MGKQSLIRADNVTLVSLASVFNIPNIPTSQALRTSAFFPSEYDILKHPNHCRIY